MSRGQLVYPAAIATPSLLRRTIPWAAISLGALLAGLCTLPSCRGPSVVERTPPLAELIASLSESGGYFDTDNLISNETAYIQVVDRLAPAGGAYIGVGPDQNFTYIARVRPRWAFIVDIRKENMLQHLLFNALFSKAESPYEYLCWMFSRPVKEQRDPGKGAGIEAVVSAFERAEPQRQLFEENLKVLLHHIEEGLGIHLAAEDRQAIRSIYDSFFRDQLNIRFHSYGRPPMPYHPTYRRLLLARSPRGSEGHFLAAFEGYAFVRELARSGHIVPVVGDFAGPHALKAVGQFLAERHEPVSAFYVSNVEFYLMRSGRFASYVDNLRALPLADNAVFIRAYFDYGLSHPGRLPGHRSTVILQRMKRFLALYDVGAYESYWDVCTVDYVH